MFDSIPTDPEILVNQKAFRCSCGKEHRINVRYIKICPGAVNDLPQALHAVERKKPFIVCDENTYNAGARIAAAVLDGASVPYTLHVIVPQTQGEGIKPNEWSLGEIAMHFDHSCDCILAVGGGVIIDLCKSLAHVAAMPCIVLATSPSMDAIASDSSSMEVHCVKRSLYNASPAGIICDVDIMAEAPQENLLAGIGDMIAKYVSICEWRISALVTGEYFCPAIAEMMRSSLKGIMEVVLKIPGREKQAIQTLAQGLVLSGMAMTYAGITRPASGLEHYFSHVWEMFSLARKCTYRLHGIQVGVGTLISVRILHRLAQMQPQKESFEKAAQLFCEKKWEKGIRRVFYVAAPELLALEKEYHLNSAALRLQRFNNICDNWDKIIKIIQEELPDEEWLYAVMREIGLPTSAEEIGISHQDLLDAFEYSRNLRNKYLTSTLIWDLGMTENFLQWLKGEAFACMND